MQAYHLPSLQHFLGVLQREYHLQKHANNHSTKETSWISILEEKKYFLKFSSHVRFIDSRVRVFVFDCFLLVGCLVLFGFVFVFSFSKYNNLKQGNLKKRILKKDTPSVCVKLLTEDTFKPSTIWWSISIRNKSSKILFKKALKKYYLAQYWLVCECVCVRACLCFNQ